MCSCFEQKTRAVGAGCTTWTDPAARSDARDISQNIRCLEDIRAHLFRRESRRYNVLRPGMRNNLVAGLGDCPNDLRETLRKNSTGHHACANPGSDEHIQEPFDTAIGAVASPGERVGIERAGRQCIPHGTDAGGLAVVHAS